MRKHLLFFFFSFISICTFAQTEDGHMKFMGISMNQPVNSFVKELKKKGLIKIESTKSMILLKGTFASINNCYIGVKRGDDEGETNKRISVIVLFPGTDNWETLSSLYFSYKQMLTIKHGEPDESQEEFDCSEQPTTNSDCMHQLRMRRCKYKSNFNKDYGTINLFIDLDTDNNGAIMIGYIDRDEKTKSIQETLDDL